MPTLHLDFQHAGLALLLTLATPSLPAQTVDGWINEFHYDNAGTDTGEFVEVVLPVDFTALAAVRLTLYNGGDGRPYGTAHGLDTFTPGEAKDGFMLYSKPLSGTQNGAPDGMSLDVDGRVLQFISYEGSFTASAGPAAGLTAFDIGVAEGDTTAAGSSLGLFGTGSAPGDFLWQPLGGATPGLWNHGQMLIPEPGAPGLALLAAAVLLAVRRVLPPR